MENHNGPQNQALDSDSNRTPEPEDGNDASLPTQTGHEEPQNFFEAKRERRINRLRERADKKKREGERSLAQAQNIASFIPPGQPILVGHHSERRHRRDLDRINGHTRKGFDALDASKRLEQRAISAEENRAIFSDDPTAGEKLEEIIGRLESRQNMMREVNRVIRSGKSLSSLGFSDAAETKLKTADFLGRVGFPDYTLKNNGANIRRLKARLESLRREQERPTPADLEKNGIRLVENAEENRVQLFFPGKPSEAVRLRLKREGFKWASFNGCWQRHRSAYATQLAKRFLEEYCDSSAESD
jgi:hypothetical protein